MPRQDNGSENNHVELKPLPKPTRIPKGATQKLPQVSQRTQRIPIQHSPTQTLPRLPSESTGRVPRTTGRIPQNTGRVPQGTTRIPQVTDRVPNGSRSQHSMQHVTTQTQHARHSKRSRVRRTRMMQKYLPIILPGLASVAIIIAIIVSMMVLTQKNAFKVSVGDKFIGNIPFTKDMTDTFLLDNAKSFLETEQGAPVEVNEVITIEPIHAAKKNISTFEAVVIDVASSLTYRVEATTITVNGTEIATVKNEAEADNILNAILDTFKQPGQNITKAEFVDKVEKKPVFLKKEDIDSTEVATERLSAHSEVVDQYIVKDGDNLSKIAQTLGMSFNDLLAANEGLSATSTIRVGQRINYLKQNPLLSVKTIEEITLTEPEKAQTQQRANPNQPKNYQKVIQTGKDGQSDVTYEIIRVNGFETEPRKEIGRKTISEPVPQVVEVGTKK